MNDPDERLPDEMLSDLLAPLRGVNVPDDVRAANRAAIARALARHTRAPWWRRTVAVPVPLAVAATVAIIAASVALLRPATMEANVGRGAQPPVQNQLVVEGSKVDAVGENTEPQHWSVSRSYLQSIESLATTRVPLDSASNQQE